MSEALVPAAAEPAVVTDRGAAAVLDLHRDTVIYTQKYRHCSRISSFH